MKDVSYYIVHGPSGIARRLDADTEVVATADSNPQMRFLMGREENDAYTRTNLMQLVHDQVDKPDLREEDERFAEELNIEMGERKVRSRVWWDRGPHCVQIFLSKDPKQWVADESPCFLVYAERDTTITNVIKWRGQIINLAGPMEDITVEFIQREHFGDTVSKVADDIQTFLGCLMEV